MSRAPTPGVPSPATATSPSTATRGSRPSGEAAALEGGGYGDALHTLVVGSSSGELVDQVLPAVRSAIACRERVTVNLAPGKLEAIRDRLGADAGGVEWTDTTTWLAHPVRRLRAFEELVAEHRERPFVRHWFVGEFPFPSDYPELGQEWERFDALLNEVLVGSSIRMICAYDRSELPPEVIERAHHAHPQVGLHPVEANPAHVPSEQLLQRWSPDSLPIPADASRLDGDVRPVSARRLLREAPAAAGLDPDRHDELTLVVSELVTNAWRAGASWVSVACWRERGELVIQVDDDGTGLDNPFAGYRSPSLRADNGRGLWIARQLADVVQVAPRRPGTSVRVRAIALDHAGSPRGGGAANRP